MDQLTDHRHLYEEVIATADPFEFVRRAYRVVLRREATDAEIRWRGRLLKYVPFYTRDRFLRRLFQSPEAGLMGRATATAGEVPQQGTDRDQEARQAMAVVGERVQALEARMQSTEGRLIATMQAITAGVNDLVARPTPEPYTVSLVCERLDRLEAWATHMRAWAEQMEAEFRTATGPILRDQRAGWERSGDLRTFERKVFSQQGEDGIIEEIFRRIGETNRYFVEFGVETGLECNSARLARECGWSGLFMEADPDEFPILQANYAPYPGVRCVRAMVHPTNIQQLFADAGVPPEPDLLVIDIDGNDYWVWKAVVDYRPRVVVVEYNAFYPPPSRWVMAEDPTFSWKQTDYYGASLGALSRLGKSKGYDLVGTDSRGVNAFFVRSDCAADRFLDPAAHYHFSPFAYRPYPHFEGPALEG